MQENTTTSTSTGELANVPLTGADKVAYAFYATAATAALVGQVWAGVTHIPWPEEGFSPFLKIALVTPAVAVIELGGVATAALADLRRRKGEQAYAYRAMSLFAAIVALVFNVVGHWRPEERFLAFGFGGLSAFAYVLWLIHSSARRRDALRRAGQMATTGPVYGVVQWAREPKVTWLARSLALEHGYGLYESLRQAREQMRNKARRDAIAGTVAEYIRSEHQDERLAKIAETTYDPDRLAGMLEERINYEVVTNKLTRAISPPPEPADEPAGDRSDLRAAVWVVEGSTPRPQQLRSAPDGGVSLRDEDAWGEAMTGELMAVDYLPYDRSTDAAAESVAEAVVVEDEGEREHVVPSSSAQARSGKAKAEPLVQKPQPPSPFAPPEPESQPALIRSTPAAAATAGSGTGAAAAMGAAGAGAVGATTAGSADSSTGFASTTPSTATPSTTAHSTTPHSTTPHSTTAHSTTAPSFTPAAGAPVGSTPSFTAPVLPEPMVEEPSVVAREVTARATSSSSSAPSSSLEKKRMRAWALLSDWPADRPRTAATLASAIASSERDAERFIAQYDAEHGTSNLTLVANAQN